MDKQKWGDNRNLRAAAQQLSTYNGTRLPQTDKISSCLPNNQRFLCVTIPFKPIKTKVFFFKVTKQAGNSQSLTVFLEVRDDHSEKNPEFLL